MTTPEKFAVAVCGFNRPGYFKKTVDALLENKPVQDGRADVFFLIDGGSPKSKDCVAIAEQIDIPNKIIVEHATNIGCGRNLIRARELIFDDHDYDYGLVMEDDLVISPDYIELAFHIDSWLHDLGVKVGTVQCWAECKLPFEEKVRHAGAVVPTTGHFWAYLMSRKAWGAIRPIMLDYRETFLEGTTHYGARDHMGIRHWLASLAGKDGGPFNPRMDGRNKDPQPADPTRYATGQDAATNAALWHVGLARITTRVNRATYIGVDGIHSTRTHYEKKGFHEITRHDIPGDPIRDDLHFQVPAAWKDFIFGEGD